MRSPCSASKRLKLIDDELQLYKKKLKKANNTVNYYFVHILHKTCVTTFIETFPLWLGYNL